MLNRIYTIGHSTRSIEELLTLLKEHSIECLADIRRYPGSRRHPQFTGEAFRASLESAGIVYLHFEELGGRRRPALDSPNRGWRNDQFRAYADHMSTQAFQQTVSTLAARDTATAVMCAEAVPWRCHRNLLADELAHRGIEVIHILGAGSTAIHAMNPIAVIRDGQLIYPPAQEEMFGSRRV
ncbi:MAG TPA: DUF488 domain-containing protein [Thermoanaerobaculia bacterium]